jgi:hypothetical protein
MSLSLQPTIDWRWPSSSAEDGKRNRIVGAGECSTENGFRSSAMISQPNLRRFLGFHRLVIEVRTWLGCEASFVRDYRAFHNGPSACSLSLLFSELGIFTHWSRNLYLVFCELGLLNQPCSHLHISREIFSNLFLSFTHNRVLRSHCLPEGTDRPMPGHSTFVAAEDARFTRTGHANCDTPIELSRRQSVKLHLIWPS